MTTKTELLNNGVVVATKTTAPFYSWDWTPSTSGASSLTYKRYEDGVLVFTSGAITGTVDAVSISISPDQLTNKYLWYDGTDTAKMTKDGSNNVTELTNKISLNKLTGSGVLYDPIDEVLRWGSAGDILQSGVGFGSINKDDTFHIFMAFKLNSAPSSGFNAMFQNSLGTSDRVSIGFRDGNLVAGYYNGSAWTTKGVNFTDTASFHLIEYRNVAGVVTAFLDHVELTETGLPVTNISTNNFMLGNSSLATDWDMLQVVAANSEVTTQRDGLLQWFSTNYGL